MKKDLKYQHCPQTWSHQYVPEWLRVWTSETSIHVSYESTRVKLQDASPKTTDRLSFSLNFFDSVLFQRCEKKRYNPERNPNWCASVQTADTSTPGSSTVGSIQLIFLSQTVARGENFVYSLCFYRRLWGFKPAILPVECVKNDRITLRTGHFLSAVHPTSQLFLFLVETRRIWLLLLRRRWKQNLIYLI